MTLTLRSSLHTQAMSTSEHLCLKYGCCLIFVVTGCVCILFGVLPDDNPWESAIEERCRFDAQVFDRCTENEASCINQTIEQRTFYYEVEGDTCNGTITMHIPCASACDSSNDEPGLPNDKQYYQCWIVECEAMNGIEISSKGKAYFSFVKPKSNIYSLKQE